jgi:hypothetical protein
MIIDRRPILPRQLITIPISGNLKIGLLKSAIKKAGLDDEEFMRLLKE